MGTLEVQNPDQDSPVADYLPQYPPKLQAKLNSTNNAIEEAEHREAAYRAMGPRARTGYEFESEASAQFQAIREYHLKRHARHQRVSSLFGKLGLRRRHN